MSTQTLIELAASIQLKDVVTFTINTEVPLPLYSHSTPILR